MIKIWSDLTHSCSCRKDVLIAFLAIITLYTPIIWNILVTNICRASKCWYNSLCSIQKIMFIPVTMNLIREFFNYWDTAWIKCSPFAQQVRCYRKRMAWREPWGKASVRQHGAKATLFWEGWDIRNWGRSSERWCREWHVRDTCCWIFENPAKGCRKTETLLSQTQDIIQIIITEEEKKAYTLRSWSNLACHLISLSFWDPQTIYLPHVQPPYI